MDAATSSATVVIDPQPFGAPPAVPTPPAPVEERERITAIDALRGVALLGILILNIWAFSMPGAAYINPTAYGDLEGANYWVWYFSHLLCDQKFMTIFSMLFGAGIVLMTSRIEQAGRSSAGVQYRRMGWLVLFGLLHAHLIWYGDILYGYGMCGLGAWFFRKFQPKWLLLIGTALLTVPIFFNLAMGLTMPHWPAEALVDMQQDWAPSAEIVAQEVAVYQGSWLDQMSNRVPTAFFFQTFIFAIWGAWRVGGLMLIGMALFKLGVFSARRSNQFYLSFILLALLVGLPLTGIGVYRNFAVNWDVMYSFFLGSIYNYVGSVFTSLGWVGLVMLIIKHGALNWLMRRLQAVGRMALTNYLMQSLICTTIFYGHGLGYFGQVERTGQFAIVVGVWIVQLIISPIWLKYFLFGPMEWVWRSLTYWRVQPVRRRAASTSPGAVTFAG